MAQVTMPDGTVVEMPDQLDPQMGQRLRAFQQNHSAPPSPQAPPASFGNTLAGEAELGGAAVGNVIPNALNAVVDLFHRVTGGDTTQPGPVPTFHAGQAGRDLVQNVKDLLPKTTNGLDVSDEELRSTDPTGKVPIEQLRADYSKQGNKPTSQLISDAGAPVLGDVLEGAKSVAGDVAAVAPVAGIERSVAGAAGAAGEEIPQTVQAGFRAGEGHPIAQGIAGTSGKEALTLHNQQVGDAIAHSEAGVPIEHQGMVPSYDTLSAAREGPNGVYNRTANALPDSALNEKAQGAVTSAGAPEGGRVTTGSPAAQQQIEALRTQLLDPTPRTGQQWVNELRGLRQEGFTNIGSDDVSNQQLGKAQLDMARAVEGHIADTLPANADVTLEQFQGARQALAKNYAMQGALRGNNFDLQAIARAQRADPELLTGGSKAIADFANANPDVTGLGSRIYQQPSFAGDVGKALGSGQAESLLTPSFWTGIGGGQALARRILTGNTGTAVRGAQEMFPGRLGDEFAPRVPETPPAQPPPKLLSAPAMVNAGGGATTSNLLSELGLTPDVQAAAGAHPGAPRPGAPVNEPAPREMPSVEFRGPENWSPQLQTGNGLPPAAARRFGGPSLADLLSEGVEQKPPAELTAGPMGAPPQQGVPFRVDPTHAAGGLSLADDLTGPEHSWFKDLSGVMSQGVPEDIAARAEPGHLTNNASGESSASVEAINRDSIERAGGKDRFLVDPDGKMWPIRGVDAVDAKAPKGSIIIQRGVGADPFSILDRGGLPQGHAKGLLNRALAGGTGMSLADLLGASG